MKLAFYAPFKPLDHPHPSGDRTIGRGLVSALGSLGFDIRTASRFRARHLHRQPWRWAALGREMRAARARVADCALWLSYHSYYKAPDALGPEISRRLGIPYALFQGIYSTKVSRDAGHALGFAINRQALRQAAVVFANRSLDLDNLRRIVPESKLVYVRPGIDTASFGADAQSRERLRAGLCLKAGETLVVTAAMFRDDVKTKGLLFLLRAAARAVAAGADLRLMIAGGGVMEPLLRQTAQLCLPGRHHFLGLLDRAELASAFGAADLFAFPGFRESLGQVYLEAQSLGLPVLAMADGGIPEVVDAGRTGILTPVGDEEAYAAALLRLCADPALRQSLGLEAARYVRKHHELHVNMGLVASHLRETAARHSQEGACPKA